MPRVTRITLRGNASTLDARAIQSIASALVRAGLRPSVEPGAIVVPVEGRDCRLRLEAADRGIPTPGFPAGRSGSR
jgi:hypothetical protein